jgi:NADPH2:quinone reductase
MKAIQIHKFGGPEELILEEVRDPVPGPGQLLIDVKAAGVNPVDTTFRSGAHPLAKSMKLPWIPGIDVSGVVAAIGESVKGFEIGDSVFGPAASGGYAEKALLPAFKAAKLPQKFNFLEGASLPVVLYTAYYALIYQAEIRPGETVLVHAGAGGVGSMAVQIGKAAGARVITTVSSKEKADFCKKLGADVVINYKEEDFATICLQQTEGRGVDAVIEMVASENLDSDFQALKKFGRLVILGAGTGKEPSALVNFPVFYSKNIVIKGMSLMNADNVFEEMVPRIGQLLEEGKIKAAIAASFPLEDAAKAHEYLLKGKFCGKVALEVG